MVPFNLNWVAVQRQYFATKHRAASDLPSPCSVLGSSAADASARKYTRQSAVVCYRLVGEHAKVCKLSTYYNSRRRRSGPGTVA